MPGFWPPPSPQFPNAGFLATTQPPSFPIPGVLAKFQPPNFPKVGNVIVISPLHFSHVGVCIQKSSMVILSFAQCNGICSSLSLLSLPLSNIFHECVCMCATPCACRRLVGNFFYVVPLQHILSQTDKWVCK